MEGEAALAPQHNARLEQRRVTERAGGAELGQDVAKPCGVRHSSPFVVWRRPIAAGCAGFRMQSSAGIRRLLQAPNGNLAGCMGACD